MERILGQGSGPGRAHASPNVHGARACMVQDLELAGARVCMARACFARACMEELALQELAWQELALQELAWCKSLHGAGIHNKKKSYYKLFEYIYIYIYIYVLIIFLK